MRAFVIFVLAACLAAIHGKTLFADKSTISDEGLKTGDMSEWLDDVIDEPVSHDTEALFAEDDDSNGVEIMALRKDTDIAGWEKDKNILGLHVNRNKCTFCFYLFKIKVCIMATFHRNALTLWFSISGHTIFSFRINANRSYIIKIPASKFGRWRKYIKFFHITVTHVNIQQKTICIGVHMSVQFRWTRKMINLRRCFRL